MPCRLQVNNHKRPPSKMCHFTSPICLLRSLHSSRTEHSQRVLCAALHQKNLNLHPKFSVTPATTNSVTTEVGRRSAIVWSRKSSHQPCFLMPIRKEIVAGNKRKDWDPVAPWTTFSKDRDGSKERTKLQNMDSHWILKKSTWTSLGDSSIEHFPSSFAINHQVSSQICVALFTQSCLACFWPLLQT